MSKILIADDEVLMRILLEQALEDLDNEKEEIEILAAENGIEALEIIRAQRPDIVFLDVMMPGMNGYDVCRQVKKDIELRNTFIVILTAKGEELDKSKGMEVGADIYMTKPFDPDTLVRKTAEVLAIRPRAAGRQAV